MPVLRQRQRPPLRRRAPVLPARRPGLLGDHALALGAHLRGGSGVEDRELLHLREAVLVLPLPRSVGTHGDVQLEVREIEAIAPNDERSLEVHVPAEEFPRLVPEELDRVCVALAHEAQTVRPSPNEAERRPVCDQSLGVTPVLCAHRALALGSRLAVEPVPGVPTTDVVAWEAAADPTPEDVAV